ncbi:MAG: 30S ribosomal protein S12 methylthiotransferase RimO [Erysipelotrichaceae bacterium]
MKIGFVSLGCSKNLVDSERILGLLMSKAEVTNDFSEAEMLFVNTCGFIESAKKESIDTILELAEYKKIGKCKKVFVLGCLAQRYVEDLKKSLPEVDRFITIKEYPKLKDILNSEINLNYDNEYGADRIITNTSWSAYLKIAEGCDNRCAYCAIPIIRKGFVSEPLEKLVTEAKDLANKGVSELVLIAQDSTRYGMDLYGESKLIELLRELNKITSLKWIRILYMYPDLLSDELIVTMNELEKVILYFDLPLQHGSNNMLKLMHRRGSIEDFEKKIEKIESLNKPYVLRTTMMVGHPGETEDDFQKLLQLIAKIKFHKLGAFIYSAEDDTPAYSREKVDPQIAQERFSKLLLAQQQYAQERNNELIDSSLEVLIEGFENGLYYGRSIYQAPDGVDGKVYIESKEKLNIGAYYFVTITKVNPYDLFAVFEK